MRQELTFGPDEYITILYTNGRAGSLKKQNDDLSVRTHTYVYTYKKGEEYEFTLLPPNETSHSELVIGDHVIFYNINSQRKVSTWLVCELRKVCYV